MYVHLCIKLSRMRLIFFFLITKMNITVNIGFAQTTRAVEHALGIPNSFLGLYSGTFSNVTDAIANTARSPSLAPEIRQALIEAIPIFTKIAELLGVNIQFDLDGLRSRLAGGRGLVTKYEFKFRIFSLIVVFILTISQLYGC